MNFGRNPERNYRPFSGWVIKKISDQDPFKIFSKILQGFLQRFLQPRIYSVIPSVSRPRNGIYPWFPTGIHSKSFPGIHLMIFVGIAFWDSYSNSCRGLPRSLENFLLNSFKDFFFILSRISI